jgi:hypothetical protein
MYEPMNTGRPHAVKSLIREIPVGSLIRVNWLEKLDADEWDAGIKIDDISECVVILEWHPKSSFIDTNEKVAVEFTCLWRGELFSSTSFCIEEIMSKG